MPKEIDSGRLQEDIEIDDTDLAGEVSRQPSRYFFWGSTWARAESYKRKMKVALKEVEARLSNEFRQLVSKEQPKLRITDSMIQNFLYSHPEYLKVEAALRNAEYTADLLDIARESFKQRHHSLQSLFRQNDESRIYGNEFKQLQNMKEVFEDRLNRKAKEN